MIGLLEQVWPRDFLIRVIIIIVVVAQSLRYVISGIIWERFFLVVWESANPHRQIIRAIMFVFENSAYRS